VRNAFELCLVSIMYRIKLAIEVKSMSGRLVESKMISIKRRARIRIVLMMNYFFFEYKALYKLKKNRIRRNRVI